MSSWKKVLVHQGVVPDDLAASGTNGQVLAVNGAGALAWADDSDYTDTEAIAAINGETSLDIDITGNAATVTNGVYNTGSITQLSDVTSAGSGAIITVAERVGFGSAYALASGATSANTAEKIVKRDASGNFSAGQITADAFVGNITGDVTGNASGNAATVTNGVYTTGDQNIGGNKTFNDNVTVSGNLTVSGTSTSVDTTHLKVQDQVLEINYDAATSAYATTDSAIILGHANHANGAKIINHAGTGLRFTTMDATDVIGAGGYVEGGTTTAGDYASIKAKNMVSSAKVSGTFANFANSAGPPSPTVGDLYYDSSDDELKIYI